MKMAKATEKDIDAAGDAMSVLNAVSSGYYPARDGDEDAPLFFDPDDHEHLRKFYDLMNATLDKSAGWPSRVIGGMCFVILFDQNEIVDPSADTLELHPKFEHQHRLLANCRFALDSLLQAKPVLAGMVCGETTLGNLRAELGGVRRTEAGAPT